VISCPNVCLPEEQAERHAEMASNAKASDVLGRGTRLLWRREPNSDHIQFTAGPDRP
jgi:hypothetical protein